MATTFSCKKSLTAIGAALVLAISACGSDDPPTRAEFVDHMMSFTSNIGETNRDSWEENYGCIFDAMSGENDDLLITMMGWDDNDDAQGTERDAVNEALGECMREAMTGG